MHLRRGIREGVDDLGQDMVWLKPSGGDFVLE